MKTYIKPVMKSEIFAPNEFIAACESYFVGCLVNGSDSLGHKHNAFNDGSGCKHYENQLATLTGSGVSVVEINAPSGQGTLTGYNTSWTDNDGDGKLSIDDTVLWTTKDQSGNEYLHNGKIYSANAS